MKLLLGILVGGVVGVGGAVVTLAIGGPLFGIAWLALELAAGVFIWREIMKDMP